MYFYVDFLLQCIDFDLTIVKFIIFTTKNCTQYGK